MKAKRVIAVLCLVVMMLGMVSTAFAATKPSVTINSSSKNQTVKRGKTAKIYYKLKSGSYTQQSGQNRAALDVFVTKGSKTGSIVATDSGTFSGNLNMKTTWKTKKSLAKGTYTILYATYYRKTAYATKWYASKTASTKIYLK